MKRITVGILAHVDSGKTTLAESLLYKTGEIRKLGRVDHRDTFLDTHSIERDRGITIFSKQAVFNFGNTEFMLLDTPGHVDFSTETERTLCVLDYAILVVSGAEGVQSHTETLWKLLKHYKIPTFLFVNKMDLSEIQPYAFLKALEQKLHASFVNFGKKEQDFYERIAETDEDALNEFLENGTVGEDTIRKAVKDRKLFPCYFGSALKMDGVDAFLEGIDQYTTQEQNQNFGLKVFKISEDEQGNRLTHLKVTGGSLKVKTLLEKADWSEKINQIRIYSGSKFKTAEEVSQGAVCAVTGLSKTFPGEGFGCEKDSKGLLSEPVLSYCASFPGGGDLHTILGKLKKLEQENPELGIVWNERLQEIHIKLMGEVQLEVVKRLIEERYGLEVEFGEGSISYKETIKNRVEGVGHYEPLRHYAEVHLLLEPLPLGSGIRLEADVSEDVLDKNWQRLIMTHLAEKTHLGVLTGAPLTDVKITLAAGKAHLKHTEGGDFRQSTYRAVRQGLMQAESVLLEPWYAFTLEIPTESVGRAMTDIQQMNGNFSAPETDGEFSVLQGFAPVSAMRNYHSAVMAYTGGRGRLSLMLKGYEPCLNAQEVIEQIGYNPDLDTENPADSVFCSHGAGFLVKWDEVHDHMHLESVLESAKTEAETVTPQKVRSALSRIATDKELKQIFERTYGAVREVQPDYIFETPKVKKEKPYVFKGMPAQKGPEYLLVDGYNVIFAWDELKALADDNLEHARERLVEILCTYKTVKEVELIVVFDAYKVKKNPGSVEEKHGIHVVYTKTAETADMYIEKACHDLGKKHKVRVVTSDYLEQLIILGSGALRIPAAAFLGEIKEVEQTVKQYLKGED